MHHHGISFEKLKIALFEFTSCGGCQLQFVNRESTLLDFLNLLDIKHFREISSDSADDYDIVLIEGSITRNDEIERLQTIRSRAKILIAIGACACFGGVNNLKNKVCGQTAVNEVYPDMKIETLPARKISDIVTVDLFIYGCPISKEEVERIIINLVLGSQVELPKYPVCVECKAELNICLFDLGEICLGPITRAGCNAVCTTGKTACLGCRGPAEEINMSAFLDLVRKRQLNENELKEKLSLYNAFEGLLLGVNSE
ncbi:MAG: NADH:ubiquinone oxidoreductase [Chlorobiaceae bacterium]